MLSIVKFTSETTTSNANIFDSLIFVENIASTKKAVSKIVSFLFQTQIRFFKKQRYIAIIKSIN